MDRDRELCTKAATLERPLLSIAMRPVDFRDVHLIPGGRDRDAEREGHVEFLDADGKRVAASGMGLRGREARSGCNVLNSMAELGKHESQAIGGE